MASAPRAPVPSIREWSIRRHVKRTTVDLSPYPDLVVMYLGMRVNSLRGIPTLLKFGHRIRKAVRENPDGLLLHEPIAYSLRQIGMRQYWRDLETLERWASAEPHRTWWREFLEDPKGTGFWHETYFMGGGMEAIYDGMDAPMGFTAFAPAGAAEGGMFSARRRLARQAEKARARPVPVDEPGAP